MTADELREELNRKYGTFNKEWPDHLEVDPATYAYACQSVFENKLAQEDRSAVKRVTLSFGINNGIMFKNVELILTPEVAEAKSEEPKFLNINELKTMYMLLQSQYISYENPNAINLIRKVRSIIGEDA